MIEDFRFPPVKKDPGESLHVTLNLYRYCASVWRPNEVVGTNEYMRPPVPNGFAYQATTAGLTGSKLPPLPTIIDASVPDGSVIWTCRAAGTNGLNEISAPSAVSDPVGLTIANVSVSEATKILATYSGGELEQDFDAVFSFTLNAVPRVARQRVEIRKR